MLDVSMLEIEMIEKHDKAFHKKYGYFCMIGA